MIYRCAHGMITVLELRVLELTPHFYSDTMPQYLEQTIRDAQSMVPGLPEVDLQPFQLLKKEEQNVSLTRKDKGVERVSLGNKWRTTSFPRASWLRPLVT